MRGRRILLVADRTAALPHVRDAVLARHAYGSCQVTLLIPSVPSSTGWTWDEAEVRDAAYRRMRAAVAELRRSGITVRGVLGDFSPMQAICDEVGLRSYEEIIISTLPSTISRWLKQDLPTRTARAFPEIRVTHLATDSADPASRLGSIDPAA